jgi:hypothetical protein
MKTTTSNRRTGVCFSRFNNSNFLLLAVGLIASCLPARAQTDKEWEGLPDPNSPWPASDKKGRLPSNATEKTTTTTTSPVTPTSKKAADTVNTESDVQPKSFSQDSLTAPPPKLKAPKATKHEVAASGDVFLGDGNVTLPLLYSLSQVPAFAGAFTPTAVDADRKSTYVGATFSYSYGQSWYFDLSYARGDSSGTVPVDFGAGGSGPLDSDFSIKDDWYQAYLKYTFPQLRGKRLSAYLRVGVSYVQADLTDQTLVPSLGLYNQTDETTDLLGNLGFGVGYRLYTGKRFRLGLQLEGEGFYGTRSQDTLETLDQSVFGLPLSAYQSATIDNKLYGGIGRATLHFEYRLGQAGLMKVFADLGAQAKYTQVSYPDGAGSFNELLWGPYGKLGFSYSF